MDRTFHQSIKIIGVFADIHNWMCYEGKHLQLLYVSCVLSHFVPTMTY